MLTYICGNTATETWQEDFEKAEDWLKRNAMKPINSGKLVSALPPLTYEQYTYLNYRLIEMSKCVFMIDGWQDSKTANAELQYAKTLGKTIKYQDYYKEFRKKEKPNVEQTF